MKKYTIVSIIFFLPTIMFALFCMIMCTEYFLFVGNNPLTIGGQGSIIADFLNFKNPNIMPTMAVLSGLCSIGCITTVFFYSQLFKNKVVFKNMDEWENYQLNMYNSLRDLEKAKKMYNDKLVELTLKNGNQETNE